MLLKTVEIVRENWLVAYFYCENKANIFYAKIQANLIGCFRQNMQVGRRHAKWKVLYY